MKRKVCWLFVVLLAVIGCAPPPPPIVIRAPPFVLIPPQGRPGLRVLAPAQFASCPVPLRLRVWNATQSHIFEFWIDPEMWDDKGAPAEARWLVFPATLAYQGPQELLFCLSPGSHDVYYRSFWDAGPFGSRPGPAGEIPVRLWNLEQPGPYGRQVIFEIRGGRDP